tara:strand:- start:1300 stop:1908 length:609 start_codon:yes stop_codon:yes gene_type:complete
MFGEDLIIDKIFKNKKKGTYVDVGCYHPIDGNNTYLLFKRGWNGINIDLNKTSIDLFKKARNKDLNLNFAISNTSKKIKFYFRKSINMLNTINKNFAKNNFLKGYKTAFIESKTLNSILENSIFSKKKIDFLNIDIEGNEINALKSLNFYKYSPKLICIEIHKTTGRNNKNQLKNNRLYKFLIKRGYKHIWNKEFSYIFKKK